MASCDALLTGVFMRAVERRVRCCTPTSLREYGYVLECALSTGMSC